MMVCARCVRLGQRIQDIDDRESRLHFWLGGKSSVHSSKGISRHVRFLDLLAAVQVEAEMTVVCATLLKVPTTYGLLSEIEGKKCSLLI